MPFYFGHASSLIQLLPLYLVHATSLTQVRWLSLELRRQRSNVFYPSTRGYSVPLKRILKSPDGFCSEDRTRHRDGAGVGLHPETMRCVCRTNLRRRYCTGKEVRHLFWKIFQRAQEKTHLSHLSKQILEDRSTSPSPGDWLCHVFVFRALQLSSSSHLVSRDVLQNKLCPVDVAEVHAEHSISILQTLVFYERLNMICEIGYHTASLLHLGRMYTPQWESFLPSGKGKGAELALNLKVL